MAMAACFSLLFMPQKSAAQSSTTDPYPWVNKEKFPNWKPNQRPDYSLMQRKTSGAKREPGTETRPAYVNNAETPYFPPIFTQDEGSCTSASRMGYMFTYEMNAYRHTSAALEANQYPSHFTWLLYYSTMLELMAMNNGIPNRPTYGGRTYSYLFGSQTWSDVDAGWMQGYDRWYNAMHNRLTSFASFPLNVRTEEGREAVKRWLWNHNGDSDFGAGGLCCFDVAATGLVQGSIGTTATNTEIGVVGKKYIKTWGQQLDHSLTIVGYDDRIEFDLDDNGKYGETDKDEKGAWIIANSWGTTWANKGFIYCPYKYAVVLGTNGGTYGPDAEYQGYYHPEVFYVRKNFRPLRTLKATVQYSKRSELQIMMGVSQDTTAETPDYLTLMEHFNHCGNGILSTSDMFPDAETPMLGRWADGMHSEPMEFGYDLTDLTNGLDESKPYKFFFIINTKPKASGTGHILSCSVINYEFDKNGVEVPCPLPAGGVEIRNTGAQTRVSWVVQGEPINAPRNATITDALHWDAPYASAYELTNYKVYKNNKAYGTVDAATRTMALNGDKGRFSVSAVYACGDTTIESKKSAPVSNDTEAGIPSIGRKFNYSGFTVPSIFTLREVNATLEYWLKPGTLADNDDRIAPASGNFVARANAKGQFIAGWLADEENFTSAEGVLKSNVWSHIAIVAKGNTMTGYVDGKEVGHVTSGNYRGMGSFNNLVFGTSAATMNGTVAEVRLWNEARTPEQIARYMHCSIASPASEPYLVAYYKMDTVTVDGTLYLRDAMGQRNAPLLDTKSGLGESAPLTDSSLHAAFTVTDGSTLLAGRPIVLRNASTANAVSWKWNCTEAGITLTGIANPEVTFPKAGDYQVQLTVQDASGHTADTTQVVHVGTLAKPVARFAMDTTRVAAGDRLYLRNTNNEPFTTYEWLTPGADVTRSVTNQTAVSYTDAGTFSVCLKATNAAGVDSMKQEVTVVNVAPDVKFSVSPAILIKGETATLTDASRYNPTSLLWTAKNDSHIFTASGHETTMTPTIPGVYDVTLDAANAQGRKQLTQQRGLIVCNADGETGLTFSGNGERVTTTGIITEPCTQFSIEWWMYASKLTSACDHIGDVASTMQITVDDTGAMNVTVGGQTASSGSGFVIPAQWHHYAVTYRNGAVIFYRDGVRIIMSTISVRTCPALNTFVIGGTDAPFAGTIDEFRIWNKALSQVNIRSFINSPIDNAAVAEGSGLVLYYNFNQKSGNVIDATSGAHAGVRSGFGAEGDAWSSSRGVFCLNYDTPQLSDVTSKYLTNYAAPFLKTANFVNGTSRFSELKTGTSDSGWILTNTVVEKGVTTGVYVDGQKSSALTVETVWDNFAKSLINHKVYQVVTLPAGCYTFSVVPTTEFDPDNSFMAVCEGDSLCNTADLQSKALDYAELSAGTTTNFILPAETKVALGLIVNMSSKKCMAVKAFNLKCLSVEDPTDVASPELNKAGASKLTLRTDGHRLSITTPAAQMVTLTTIDGRLLLRHTIEGTFTVALPAGIYIVNGQKILVR